MLLLLMMMLSEGAASQAGVRSVSDISPEHLEWLEDWTSGFILRGFRRVGCLRDNASSAL